MKISEIIEQANRKTERLGEKTLDLRSELLGVIQDLCNHTRWYWTKKSAVLNLSTSNLSYDLTASDGANIQDFSQVAETGIKLFSGSELIGTITPEFDTEQQEKMRESSTSGKPSRYFVDGFATLNLDCIPDSAYRARIPYWACPSEFQNDGDDVPLVPAYLHKVLQKGLEAEIFRYTLGEGAAKYSSTLAQYEALKTKFSRKSSFAPGEQREVRTFSSSDAIQSTR